DFGSDIFTGPSRWLEIGVTNHNPTPTHPLRFTTLTPRQPLTPTPYAIYAAGATTASTVATAGDQPLELKVNGARGLRLESTIDGPNVVGGASVNLVAPG